MRRSKKGVSPLVATVILVGFTVVLASLFFIFGSSKIKEFAQKSFEKCSAQQAAQLDMKASCQVTSDKFSVSLQNTGQASITGGFFRINTGKEIKSKLFEGEVKPGEEKTKSFAMSQLGVTGTSIKDVGIIPIIVADGKAISCDSKEITITCST